MNYPVWYLPETGGGLLIALIAITHVFVSHFAVGGGLYLVLTERKGLRENNPDILAFTKRHAKFFMLLTMVYGGITGVGIWFIISLGAAGSDIPAHPYVCLWMGCRMGVVPGRDHGAARLLLHLRQNGRPHPPGGRLDLLYGRLAQPVPDQWHYRFHADPGGLG